MADSNVSVIVARYETYPSGEPTCFCVGFTMSYATNGSQKYMDVQVPLAQASGKTEEEVVALAYEALRPAIESWTSNVASKPSVIGTVFTPPPV